MPKVGDLVIIEGNKVGQQRREGRLVGVTGPLIRVRWSDGSESLIKPAAGSVTFAPGNGSRAGGSAAKRGRAPAKATAKGRKPAKAPARKKR